MNIEKRLDELNIRLEPIAWPDHWNILPWRISGNLIFLSGHGPRAGQSLVYGDRVGSVVAHEGKLGADLDIQAGYDAAQICGLNLLASLQLATGNLNRVVKVIKLLGMVNCVPDFTSQPEVINGASDLLVAILGEAGRHSRSAVGMSSLPRRIPVEIEMVVELKN